MSQQQPHKIHVSDSRMFIGELMTCVSCGRSERSDPAASSNWTYIELEDRSYGHYVCPQCWEIAMAEIRREQGRG
jgi:predicted RNA-binding Zn-ribbon protein involved in translation (DUF1610 family)